MNKVKSTCLATGFTLASFLAGSIAYGDSLLRPSLSLDAKTVSSQTEETNSYKTDHGSYDKEYARVRLVEGTLRNMGKEAQDVTITTYFFGRAVGTNKRVILKEEAQICLAMPNITVPIRHNSGIVEGKDLNLAAIGDRYTSGHKIEGWVMVVTDTQTKQVFCVKGSLPHLEALAKTNGELEKLPRK